MIIGSILFILVAAGLLLSGLLQGDQLYYYLSIVASALAALALVVGVRQAAARRSAEDDFDDPAPRTRGPGPAVGRVPAVDGGLAVGRVIVPYRDEAGAVAQREQTRSDPPGEPSVQFATPIETAQVAALTAHVAVVDDRPRYHLVECGHLVGRDFERLPVKEAVELGFTPCAECEPVGALLATPRR